TDFFDGPLARRLNQISEFGKIVDPVADKIAVLGVAAVLVHLGRVPLWFFGVAASRDMLILAGGLYARKNFGVTLQSTQTGKWCVAVTAAYILERILAPESPEWISALLAGASAVMMALSFGEYLKRFLTIQADFRRMPLRSAPKT